TPLDGPQSRPPELDAGSWSPRRSSGVLLVQTVISMQGPNRKLGILFIDQDGGLYFRRRDQLDVDPLVGQGLEHGGCDTRMAAHADTDNRDLGAALGAGKTRIFNAIAGVLQGLDGLVVF